MIQLIIKDLLLQRRMLGLVFLYVVLFSFSFQSMGEFRIIGMITAVGYMLVMMGSGWEEKVNSDVLWNSLPVAKWKIVGAKYLSLFAYVAVIVPISLLVSSVLTLLGFSFGATNVGLVSVAIGTILVLFMSSLYWPIYFAVGCTKARYWNFAIFFFFFFLSSTVARFVPEKPAWVDPLFAGMSDVAGSTLVATLILGVTVLIIGASFWLSLKIYSKREF